MFFRLKIQCISKKVAVSIDFFIKTPQLYISAMATGMTVVKIVIYGFKSHQFITHKMLIFCLKFSHRLARY